MKRELYSHAMVLIYTVLAAIVGYVVKEPIEVIEHLGDIFYRLSFIVGSVLLFFSFFGVIKELLNLGKIY